MRGRAEFSCRMILTVEKDGMWLAVVGIDVDEEQTSLRDSTPAEELRTG